MAKQQDLSKAITRRLSPLQKTASVAGFTSTKEIGSKLSIQDLEEELRSREIDKRLAGT